MTGLLVLPNRMMLVVTAVLGWACSEDGAATSESFGGGGTPETASGEGGAHAGGTGATLGGSRGDGGPADATGGRRGDGGSRAGATSGDGGTRPASGGKSAGGAGGNSSTAAGGSDDAGANTACNAGLVGMPCTAGAKCNYKDATTCTVGNCECLQGKWGCAQSTSSCGTCPVPQQVRCGDPCNVAAKGCLCQSGGPNFAGCSCSAGTWQCLGR